LRHPGRHPGRVALNPVRIISWNVNGVRAPR
jgi:hypothetical protein